MEKPNFENLPQSVLSLSEQIDRLEQLLINLLDKSTDSQKSKFLTVKECAHFLRISTSTIYRKVSEESIPFLKPNSILYFDKEKLIEYVNMCQK